MRYIRDYDKKQAFNRIWFKQGNSPVRDRLKSKLQQRKIEPTEKNAWETALFVANGVYRDKLDDFVDGATHYHAHYVNPSWAESKTYITRIDDHIFYRWDINYD